MKKLSKLGWLFVFVGALWMGTGCEPMEETDSAAVKTPVRQEVASTPAAKPCPCGENCKCGAGEACKCGSAEGGCKCGGTAGGCTGGCAGGHGTGGHGAGGHGAGGCMGGHAH